MSLLALANRWPNSWSPAAFEELTAKAIYNYYRLCVIFRHGYLNKNTCSLPSL